MSEANHRLKLNYNREPRQTAQTARTRNDGRKSMHGSTDTAQLTRCSSTLSGMSTAASSATTYCCSSDAQHQVSEKGFKGRLGHSIQPLQKLPQCELPSSVSSSNKPRPRRGLGRVFQSDSDSKVLHKSKKLAKPQRHESASNVPDPTNRDSFRRDRSSSAIEMRISQGVHQSAVKPTNPNHAKSSAEYSSQTRTGRSTIKSGQRSCLSSKGIYLSQIFLTPQVTTLSEEAEAVVPSNCHIGQRVSQ